MPVRIVGALDDNSKRICPENKFDALPLRALALFHMFVGAIVNE
jgi:hypothetical protein